MCWKFLVEMKMVQLYQHEVCGSQCSLRKQLQSPRHLYSMNFFLGSMISRTGLVLPPLKLLHPMSSSPALLSHNSPFTARHTSHSHLKQPNPRPSFAGPVPPGKAEAATWQPWESWKSGKISSVWEQLTVARALGILLYPSRKHLHLENTFWAFTYINKPVIPNICNITFGFVSFFSVSERKRSRNVCQFKVPFLGHPGFSDHKFGVDHALFSDTERRRTSLLVLYCSSYCWTSEDFGLCSISLQRQQYVSNFAPSNFSNQYAVL